MSFSGYCENFARKGFYNHRQVKDRAWFMRLYGEIIPSFNDGIIPSFSDGIIDRIGS